MRATIRRSNHVWSMNVTGVTIKITVVITIYAITVISQLGRRLPSKYCRKLTIAVLFFFLLLVFSTYGRENEQQIRISIFLMSYSPLARFPERIDLSRSTLSSTMAVLAGTPPRILSALNGSPVLGAILVGAAETGAAASAPSSTSEAATGAATAAGAPPAFAARIAARRASFSSDMFLPTAATGVAAAGAACLALPMKLGVIPILPERRFMLP